MKVLLLALFLSLLICHVFSDCSYDTFPGGTISVNADIDLAGSTSSPLPCKCDLDWPLLEADVRVASIIGLDVDVSLCGQCALIPGLLGNVYVRIIDYDNSDRSDSCGLVIAPSIFSLLGDILGGILFDTAFKLVPCPASLLGFNGNIVFRLREGTCSTFLKLQILNSVQPIVSVKIKALNLDIWTKLTLLDDNSYVCNNIPLGGLIGPIQVKVIALNGEIVIFTIVDLLGLEIYLNTNVQFHNGCKDCSACSKDTCTGSCSWSNNKCRYISN